MNRRSFFKLSTLAVAGAALPVTPAPAGYLKFRQPGMSLMVTQSMGAWLAKQKIKQIEAQLMAAAKLPHEL